MNIGLIGYGYWGKIIYKNLLDLKIDLKNIIIYDQHINEFKDANIETCDHIFVCTPATTHYDIVKKLLNNNKNVFCEKPLTLSTNQAKELYKISNNNNCKLFVDWTFTHNYAINQIKQNYKDGLFGNIRSIQMNRLNFGPIRHDVNARWDLSSHDVSIIQYIFNTKIHNKQWFNIKKNTRSQQYDTSIGILDYLQFNAILYSSWEYIQKDRRCVFEFDNGVLVWDDITNTISFNNKNLQLDNSTTPLHNSIDSFLSKTTKNEEHLTLDITSILED